MCQHYLLLRCIFLLHFPLRPLFTVPPPRYRHLLSHLLAPRCLLSSLLLPLLVPCGTRCFPRKKCSIIPIGCLISTSHSNPFCPNLYPTLCRPHLLHIGWLA